MREKIICIYAIVSPSGRAYIGSTKDFYSRKTQHLYKLRVGTHGCDALIAAHKKYGADNLKFEIIERCAISELIEREQWWIDNHLTCYGRMYNSSGIAGRPEHNEASKEKISRAAKGRKVSLETRAKLSQNWLGRKHTEETKAKMRKSAASNTVAREALIKSNKARAGRKLSDETKAKLRASKLGKKASPETKAKMAAAQARRYARDGGLSDATKAKISAHKGRKNKPLTEAVKAEKTRKWRASMIAAGHIKEAKND